MQNFSPLRQSPLRKSPELNKYKNEWAYLQDLQAKRQEEVLDVERKLKEDIRNMYRRDLKSTVEHQKQLHQKEQEQERRELQESPLPLHEKQISLFQQLRSQAIGQISNECQKFNTKIADKHREEILKEKEKEKFDADRRIKEAHSSQVNYLEQKREEKNYIKNELLSANQAQLEIKRIASERQFERNRGFVEDEKQQLQSYEQKRQQARENLKQKYFDNNSNNAVQEVYLENHMRKLEERKQLERAMIDDYNENKRKQEENKYMMDKEIQKQVKDNVIQTLKTQIALKQEVESAVQSDKKRYNDFLQEKDKEVQQWQSQRKHQQLQLKKEYNSELMDQILQKPSQRNEFMDQRELVMNKQVFENGVTAAVPGLIQDHRRVKQLSMISQSMGYQNQITTPETVQLYANPKQRFATKEDESPLKSSSSIGLGLNRNGSVALLSSRKMSNNDQYQSESLSPVKIRDSQHSKQISNVFLQSGKNLFN